MNERDIFQAAVEIENPLERASFLNEACQEQPGIRSHVEDLLKHFDDAGSFLERPPAELERTRLSDEQATDENSLAPSYAPDCQMSDEALRSYLTPSETPGIMGTLGQYEILEKIGQGGMGIVLKAKDTKLERIVAIKMLAPELALNPTARKRFLREAQAAAAVTHDHVVRIYAVNDSPQMPMLVMECIDGQSLQQKIDRAGALEVKEILRIGLQAALGLSAAHRQGLVHRDIKPSNILLENGIQRVKITDFGLARAVDDIGMTKTGQITGTPQYMSPEQAQGDLVDCRSDLFSLGSVMYAMCTGRAAFRADSTVAVLRRVCDDEARPIREINPEIPLPLADVVEQLMEKNPLDRFQSAEEVAEVLSGLLAQIQQPGGLVAAPLVRSQSPKVQVPRRRERFNMLAWGKLSLVLAIVLLGLGFSEATGVTKVASTIIRIVNGEGTLIIEVDDPTASVTLDGEDIVLSAEGLKKFRLKPGKHDLLVNRPGQPPERELVKIMRNGKMAIVVTQEGTGVRRVDDENYYPKLSPFEAIRWDGQSADVKVNGRWYKLKKINGVSVADIVRFAIEHHDSRWQKRIDEDLVQVLSEMGKRPGSTVDLTVVDLASGEESTLENIAMTKANRWAIYDARREREKQMPPDAEKKPTGNALSDELQAELALAERAGLGELSADELKSLKEAKHPIPELLELPVIKKILELLADLPAESRKQLIEEGYVKWEYARLSEPYRDSFTEIVEMFLKEAEAMGFGGKDTPRKNTALVLEEAHVGFAAIDYPGSKRAITFYVLIPASPVPLGMPLVPEDPEDFDPMTLGLAQFEQLKKLAEKPDSIYPPLVTKSGLNSKREKTEAANPNQLSEVR